MLSRIQSGVPSNSMDLALWRGLCVRRLCCGRSGGGIVGDVVVSVVVVGGGAPSHPINKARVPITAALAALVHGSGVWHRSRVGWTFSPKSVLPSGNRRAAAARHNGSRNGWRQAFAVAHSLATLADLATLAARQRRSCRHFAG
jgi:hypothetical protein